MLLYCINSSLIHKASRGIENKKTTMSAPQTAYIYTMVKRSPRSCFFKVFVPLSHVTSFLLARDVYQHCQKDRELHVSDKWRGSACLV